MTKSNGTVREGKVVGIHYTMRDGEGRILETSAGMGPTYYVPGTHNLAPGLEQALEGKRPGDFVSATLPPGEAYGRPRVDSERVIEAEHMSDDLDPSVGERVTLRTNGENPVPAWVKRVEPEQIVVDLNHPFAGQEIRFDVFVESVRDATEAERATRNA